MGRKRLLTAEDVRQIRERANMTQRDLAERLNVTRDTVASWEGGRSHPLGPAEILLRQIAEETKSQKGG
jgi:putative transcriptional regulator